MTLEVKSGYRCPLCGEEMMLTGGGFYYEGNFGLVEIECHDCNLQVGEYCFDHGLKGGEANSYWKLVHALERRVNGVFEKA